MTWTWSCMNHEAGPERLYHDPTIGAWWALAQDGAEGPMFFQATNIDHSFGKTMMLVQMRYSSTHLPSIALAHGRIDIDRDSERRGLALSALEQLERIGVRIPLAEVRHLLDEFVFDVAQETPSVALRRGVVEV